MQTLTIRARVLRGKGEALKSVHPLMRMSAAASLGEELAAFMVDLAAAVDSLTPYIDEESGGAGGPETLCNVTQEAAGGVL